MSTDVIFNNLFGTLQDFNNFIVFFESLVTNDAEFKFSNFKRKENY